jgi:hypothetical protein
MVKVRQSYTCVIICLVVVVNTHNSIYSCEHNNMATMLLCDACFPHHTIWSVLLVHPFPSMCNISCLDNLHNCSVSSHAWRSRSRGLTMPSNKRAEREFSNHGFVLILVMFSNTPTINLSKAYQSLDQRQSHKLAIACFSSEAHSDTISFISYQLTKGILETTFRSRNEAAFCSISAFAWNGRSCILRRSR